MNSRYDDWHPRRDEEPVYTVSIYVAAPGTPMLDPETRQLVGTSAAGHMYYNISDGSETKGYGFSPLAHNTAKGPGQIVRDEFKSYDAPAYSRTLEITKDQYDKLKEYGEAGLRKDQSHFNLQYHGATNSCIDFVWGALNHADIHRRHPMAFDTQKPYPDRDFDGKLKPLDNIQQIERIMPPVPDSPHNHEQRNGMPERGWLQKIISDAPVNDPRDPRDAGHRLYQQVERGIHGIEASLGRMRDENTDRLVMRSFVDTIAQKIESADHVAISKQGTAYGAGSFVFVIQGQDAYDERNKVARISTQDALDTPVDRSLQALGELRQQQTQVQSVALEQAPTQNAPSHGARTA
jgi:hypothetical protein